MTYQEAMFRAARGYWCARLRQHRGDVTAASRTAGYTRTTAYIVLRHLGIDPNEFRPKGLRPRAYRPLLTRSDARAWAVFLRKNGHLATRLWSGRR